MAQAHGAGGRSWGHRRSSPALLLLLCLTVCTAGAAAPSAASVPAGCGHMLGRRLLLHGNNSTVEVGAMDVGSEECVTTNNSYYGMQPSMGLKEVLSAVDNRQDSASACCASCHNQTLCNAFQWCPLQTGCSAGTDTLVLPYQGCQLIDLSGAFNESVNAERLKILDPDVYIITGFRLYITVPKLPGYDVEIGYNFGTQFNYSCTTTETGSCVLHKSAQGLKAACDADPLCLAFVFYPTGIAPLRQDDVFGVLKGGKGVQLTADDLQNHPYAATYLKLPSGGGGKLGDSSNNTMIIAAVVSSVVGAALVASSVLLIFYLCNHLRKASMADNQKTADSGSSSGLADGAHDKLDGEFVIGGSSGCGGSPLTGDVSGEETIPGDTSHGDAQLVVVAPGDKYKCTPSPPSMDDAASRLGSGGADAAAEFSAFVPISPIELKVAPYNVPVAAVTGSATPPSVAVQHASWSGSDGSGHALQQQQEEALVVEVQRALLQGSCVSGLGGGSERSSIPPSMHAAGNARELLEVFARMYNQRPAVDYAVVAQMLDQDTDPSTLAAAEHANEVRRRHVDLMVAQHRSASLSGSASCSQPSTAVSSGGYCTPQQWQHQHAVQQQYIEIAVTGSMLLQEGTAAAAGGGGLAAADTAGEASQQAGAGLAGSIGAEQHHSSLLPGMVSPPASMLPAVKEWSLQPEEIEICKRPDGSYWQLGTGAFGTCYKGLYHGQQLVAVKVLHRVEERRRGKEFEREVSLLKDLCDGNIVQFIGACLDGVPTPMLVTEFMEFGDLWRALPLKNTQGQRIFAWHKRGRRVLYDVAKGLVYLHRRRIVHLDLKSANILLSRHGTAKICDIGMARVLGNKEYLSMLSGMGTFAWSAPEVLSAGRCSEKVDLYSFGVVAWEVCTGDVPVRGEMRPLVAPTDCPQPMVELYERCIAEQPEQRPTAAELLEALAAVL